jgi:spore coat protein A, manganese oxidase
MTNRRQFLQQTAGVAAGASMMGLLSRQLVSAATVANGVSPALRKFILPLRGLGAGGIPVATPDQATYPGVDYYRLGVAEHAEVLHPDLPGPTRLWGFYDRSSGGDNRKVHLGGVVVANQGTPCRLQVANELGTGPHLLPVDLSIMGAADGPRRISTHLHGGFTPWASDGGPFHTVAPDGTLGQSMVNWLPDTTGALTHDLWYPNQQTPRLMWYHDHAIGTTRLNAYAGIATAYLLTGPDEAALLASGGALEGLGLGIPLVFQDKVFNAVADQWGGPGDLWYPSAYPQNIPGLPFPSCVPEFFGDTMLCNGAPYPTINVEPKRYRFRILNANQAGFLNLSIFFAKNTDQTTANTSMPGPNWVQIGTEGGFLAAPVTIAPQKMGFSNTGQPLKWSLLLAPAERADVIVDFSAVPVGSKLIIFNDAPGPFPGGGGGPVAPVLKGMGPDTMNLVQFTVIPLASPDVSSGRPITLPNIPALPITGLTPQGKTLNEIVDAYGRLIQMLGTTTAVAPGLFARAYTDPATEVVSAGETQVWDIYNLTMDTHPMHFHLVNVQILGRAPFNAKKAAFAPTAAFTPADPNERGWKETVRMNPGTVTRVAMKFDLPTLPATLAGYPVTLPPSPRTGGNEYVWHCHILEHEEHDMMRPLIVK